MTKYDKETIKEASKGVNFEESLICFIDLLGSTTAIEKDDVNFFNSVNEMFKLLTRICENSDSNIKYSNIKIKAFSDNIIFVHSLSAEYTCEELYDALMTITMFASLFQSIALSKKILLRGGISIGSICFNEIFVWGKALVNAYRLENCIAIFPRIVIDKKIIKSVCLHDLQSKFRLPIEKDFDEEYFVDFLVTTNDIFVCKDIQEYNLIIEELEIEFKNQNKILQKISWTKAFIARFREKRGLTDEVLQKQIEILDNVIFKRSKDNK